MTECDADILNCLCNNGYDAKEALESLDDCRVYYDCYNMSDVAYEVASECGYLDEMPEHLRNYFDFEAFGRDLDIESTFFYAGGGVYVELCK